VQRGVRPRRAGALHEAASAWRALDSRSSGIERMGANAAVMARLKWRSPSVGRHGQRKVRRYTNSSNRPRGLPRPKTFPFRRRARAKGCRGDITGGFDEVAFQDDIGGWSHRCARSQPTRRTSGTSRRSRTAARVVLGSRESSGALAFTLGRRQVRRVSTPRWRSASQGHPEPTLRCEARRQFQPVTSQNRIPPRQNGTGRPRVRLDHQQTRAARRTSRSR
jgi:hypothetical protein